MLTKCTLFLCYPINKLLLCFLSFPSSSPVFISLVYTAIYMHQETNMEFNTPLITRCFVSVMIIGFLDSWLNLSSVLLQLVRYTELCGGKLLYLISVQLVQLFLVQFMDKRKLTWEICKSIVIDIDMPILNLAN